MHRKGFALITAVVISAVMLTTVVLISIAAQSTRQIQTQQVLSQETLYRAEQALQDTVRTLRTQPTAAQQLINSGRYEAGPAADPGGQRNFHWVKVHYNSSLDVYEFFSAAMCTTVDVSTLNLASVPEQDILSRRIVRAVMKGTGGRSGTAFNYGMYSGGTFTVTGGGVMITPTHGTGNVYAGTAVSLNGTPTLKGVEFYSHGTVSLGNPTLDPATYPIGTTALSIQHPKIDAVPFPDLNQMDTQYQTLFQQFIQATGAPATPASPYNGTAGYPNTSSPLVQAAIASVLKPTSYVSGGHTYWYATMDNAYALYQAVENMTLTGLTYDQKTDLKKNVSKMVFYVRTSSTDPNAELGVGVKHNEAKDKVFDMAGTVFCPGSVTANGQTKTVGTEAFALYCRDNITINGEGEAQGAFLTGGTFTKNGAWTFTGSIAALGDVTCHGGGGMTLTYHDYNSAVTQPTSGFTSLNAVPSGWSEIDWNAFLHVS